MMTSLTRPILIILEVPEATKRTMVEGIVDGTLTTTIINTKINTTLNTEAMADNHMEWASKITTTNAEDMVQLEWAILMVCNKEMEITNQVGLKTSKTTIIKKERRAAVETGHFNRLLHLN